MESSHHHSRPRVLERRSSHAKGNTLGSFSLGHIVREYDLHGRPSIMAQSPKGPAAEEVWLAL
jgi:hypothetical protein